MYNHSSVHFQRQKYTSKETINNIHETFVKLLSLRIVSSERHASFTLAACAYLHSYAKAISWPKYVLKRSNRVSENNLCQLQTFLKQMTNVVATLPVLAVGRVKFEDLIVYHNKIQTQP